MNVNKIPAPLRLADSHWLTLVGAYGNLVRQLNYGKIPSDGFLLLTLLISTIDDS